LWAEACCLWQCARFSLRHPRYFVIFLAIWGPSLLRWRERRVVRVAFVTLQWIDDLLDGDRRSKREPLEIIDALLDDMTSRRFRREPLSRLTGALFADLDASAQDEFIALVREMRRDRVRVMNREKWAEDDLDEHHRRTFTLSVDLLLRVTGCRARAHDVAPLVVALAWCSVFRDLDEDVKKGLFNIPRDVDASAWTQARHARAKVTLRDSAHAISQLDDPQARKILGIFQRSIERFARRVELARTVNCERNAAGVNPDTRLKTRLK
jgi:phytoene/squalene synthetase